MLDQSRSRHRFLTMATVLLAVAIVLLLPTGIFFHPWAILGLGVIAGGSLVAAAAMREAVVEFLPSAPMVWYCRPGSLPVVLSIMAVIDFVYIWVSPWPLGRTNPIALAGMICAIDAFMLLGIAALPAFDWLEWMFQDGSQAQYRPPVRPPPSPPDFTPSRPDGPVFKRFGPGRR